MEVDAVIIYGKIYHHQGTGIKSSYLLNIIKLENGGDRGFE